MTNIKFYKSDLGYSTLELIGHTGYAEYGQDIVCAGISSMVNTLILSLRKVLGVKIRVREITSAGYIRIDIPKENITSHDVTLLLDCCLAGFREFAKTYRDYINLEVIDENV